MVKGLRNVTVMLIALLMSVAVFAEDKQITILATSDIHGNILPYDYYTQKPAAHGLAKVYTAVKQVRGTAKNVVLIDNGDTIQGTPLVYYYNVIDKTSKYPLAEVMNYMGYDAWVLGNHEFNYGTGVLDRIIGDMKAPVLSANTYKENGSNYVKPYTIKNVDGVKIGILGMTTKGVPNWENPGNYKGLVFNDIVAEGKKWVKILKNEEKCDIIIASVHSGIDSPNDIIQENQGRALAEACPEITAMITGHTHLDKPGETINGVIVVQPKRWGERLSRIDLMVKENEGKYIVDKKVSVNIDVKDLEPSKEILDIAKPYTDKTNEYVNTVLGQSKGEFTGLDQKVKDTALIDLIQKVQMYYGKADISMSASFNDSSRIPAGDVKIADINALYIYENFLYTIEVTGKQVKDYLEYSAKYFNTIYPGDTKITFNPLIPGYNYDMLQGVNYQIDLTQPEGSRIINLEFKGKALKDDQVLKLAVNNYRYNGGGGHLKAAGIINPKVTFDSMKEMGDDGQVRTLIMNYIQEKKEIAPDVDNNYNIVTANTERYIAKEGETLEEIAEAKGLKVESLIPVNNMTAADAQKWLYEGRIILIPVKSDIVKLSILSMNDFHGAIAEAGKNPGLAKIAGYINNERKSNPDGTILLSAGDMYQGSADSNLVYGKTVADAMNAIGFDAMAIGNHEFDWGMDKLRERNIQSEFPFLAANVVKKLDRRLIDFALPYTIIEKNGVQIAVIGISTPETLTSTKGDTIEPYNFEDVSKTINEFAGKLKIDGADLVVVVGHIGAEQNNTTKEITGEAAVAAKSTTNVDAFVTGHTHTTVAGYVKGVPIVQAYYSGRAVGHIDLYYDTKGNRVIKTNVFVDSLIPANLIADAAVKDIVDKAGAAIGPIKNEVIGTAKGNFAHNAKEKQVTMLGKWATDVMRKAVNADIAIQNGGGLRRDIPAGVVTMGIMYEVMPFDNTLYTVDLTGAVVKEALENGIMSETFLPGQFSGVTVKFDSSKPKGQRIIEVRMADGTLLDDAKSYKVVTNDFQFGGGDNYTMFKKGKNGYNTNIPVRDLLVNEIKNVKEIAPVEDVRLIDVNGKIISFAKPAKIKKAA